MRFFRVLLYFALFFITQNFALAEVSITEIMYDHSGADTDLEWVEFYNSGSDSVNLSGWKFNDGANHTLNEPPANGGMGSLEIGPSEYVVFAANANVFLGEYPSYNGNLIDTVMSLTNTSDTVSLVDGNSTTITSYTYDSTTGGAGDGSSLSKINGTWTSGDPSPGESNSSFSDSDDTSSDESGDTDDFVTYSSTEEDADILDFIPPEEDVEILSDVVIVSGIPSTFDSLLQKNNGDLSRGGYYIWNMGDGTEYTFKPAKKFEHIYYYPGEYVVTLDYYNVDSIEKDDTDRLVVKVVDSSIVLKILEDGAIEVSNTSKFEQDLNGWVIESDNISYRFSKNSILLAGKKIILSPKVTHFKSNISRVLLRYPTGEVAYEYPKSQVQEESTISRILPISTSKKVYSNYESIDTQSTIDNRNISANSANLSIPKNTYIYLSLVGLIILGVGSIFYTKRVLKQDKNNTKTEADEFELIEE